MIRSVIQQICVGPSVYQALYEAYYLGLRNLSPNGRHTKYSTVVTNTTERHPTQLGERRSHRWSEEPTPGLGRRARWGKAGTAPLGRVRIQPHLQKRNRQVPQEGKSMVGQGSREEEG